MSDDTGDKTEDPTDRRREEAREQGNVAKSGDLSAAALMFAAAAVVMILAPQVSRRLAEQTAASLSSVVLRVDAGWAVRIGRDAAGVLAEAVLPVLLLTALTALGVNVAQSGFLLAPAALAPKFSRISPLQGAKRILSIRAAAKLGVSLGKLAVLTLITAMVLWWWLPAFLDLTGVGPAGVASAIHTSASELAFTLASALLVLAVLDYGFQWWKHEQDLRMSKQELRDEMKNMDGDPQVRQRRKEAHRKLARSRELQSVKKADVVVTNPTHYAVAIKYDPERMPAPVVVAKGVDELALQIRKLAAEAGVPILERRELARQLYRDVKVGRSIPADLYEAFVEIMAYVYRLSGKVPANLSGRRRV